MNSLKVQRCFNHAVREAAARCTVCGKFFCRECITEHGGKMTCGRCLSTAAAGPTGSGLMARLTPLLLFLSGLLLLWIAFFAAGEGLLAIPASFHEGTIWQKGGWRR